MRAIVLVLALMVGAPVAQADTVWQMKSGGLTIQIAAREQANLIYQIDCMARVIRCSPDVFDRLWKSELGLTAEDQHALEEWAELTNNLQHQGRSGDPFLCGEIGLSALRRKRRQCLEQSALGRFSGANGDPVGEGMEAAAASRRLRAHAGDLAAIPAAICDVVGGERRYCGDVCAGA